MVYGERIQRSLNELVGAMEETHANAMFLIADQMVEDLGGGDTPSPKASPKDPWPILTGRSKGLPPFNRGGRGGFYVDDATGDGWQIWNRTDYAQWVNEGLAGRHRRRDGGRFVEKMWVQSEQRYFAIAQALWDEQ